jgi:DNA-binding GntR family transcriptional regulator
MSILKDIQKDIIVEQKITALRFRAYKAIKDKLINLEIKPGEKIFENELAKTLNVSRTPVREALLMLEHEKLVTCTNSLGFVARRLTAKDVEEYFAIRYIIEELVMSLVVERITDSEISDLTDKLKQTKNVIKEGNVNEIIRCETEFHDILYKATKSEVLLETIYNLVDKFQLLRSLIVNIPGGAAASAAEHKEIVDLIKKRDAKKAKKAMRLHLEKAQQKVAELQNIFF